MYGIWVRYLATMYGIRKESGSNIPTGDVNLTFASYNIRKAVGLDQRRDPGRILAILREIDADVVALQEADMRFGSRSSVLPLSAILDSSPYQAIPFGKRPDSIGWHGNALLVRRGIPVLHAEPLHLPRLEPRGAMQEFGAGWQVINPGHSFPAPRPVASFDRIVTSEHWRVIDSGVHHSALARRGSDHLPVFASLSLPKK